MAADKTGPAMGVLTSKKFSFAVLFVTSASAAFVSSTSIVERCTCLCTGAFVVGMYCLAQAIVEREVVESEGVIPTEEEAPTSVVVKSKGSVTTVKK